MKTCIVFGLAFLKSSYLDIKSNFHQKFKLKIVDLWDKNQRKPVLSKNHKKNTVPLMSPGQFAPEVHLRGKMYCQM